MQTRLQLTTIVILLGLSLAGSAFGNPTGPKVVNGQVTFGATLTVAPTTITNFQSFTIGKDEVSRFIQQSGASAVLNRVTGPDPTQMLSPLQSNSRVFLISPASTAMPTQFLIEANDSSFSGSSGTTLTLDAGRSMTLADPRSPELKVQVTAPQNRSLDVGQLMDAIGNKGVASLLTNRAGNTNATTAVIGENGNVILKSVR